MHPIFRDICDTIAPKVSHDFIITGGGASIIVTPMSKEGRDWCWEHMNLHDYPGERASIRVSPSEVSEMVKGMLEDGMKVQWEYR